MTEAELMGIAAMAIIFLAALARIGPDGRGGFQPRAGRGFVGMERDEKFYNAAAERIRTEGGGTDG